MFKGKWDDISRPIYLGELMLKRFLLLICVMTCLSGCMPYRIETTTVNPVEQAMISRSLTNIGNTDRINKKILSAKEGKPLTVAFLGSSLFVEEDEQSVSKIIFYKIKDFIGEKADLEYINFSKNGTNSIFGSLFLEKEILSKNPDLIFIDYSVYETNEQDNREAFESIVRRCLLQKNSPQVIIVQNSLSNGESKQDTSEQIAKCYNLPIINIPNAFQPEITSARDKTETFYADKLSYTDKAKKYISDFIENYLKISQKTGTEPYMLPQKMYYDELTKNPKLVDFNTLQIENKGSFEQTGNSLKIIKNNKYEPFIFTLNANNIYLVIPVGKNRNNIAEIYINAKKTTEINTMANNENDICKVFKIYSSNKKENIAVAVKIPEKTDEINEELKTEDTQNENIQENTNCNDTFEIYEIAYTENEIQPEMQNETNLEKNEQNKD